MEVRIETLDDINVYRVRHVGPYNEVGPCFDRLFAWAASIGARPGRCLMLSHDDPEFVPPERLRSDACLELETEISPPPGFAFDSVGAGRHAVYTHRGSYDGIAAAFQRLFEAWLPGSGEEFDFERPCMEVFRNSPADTAPSDLLTDLCVPLRTDLDG